MANVKRLVSPRDLLDYLNELTLPIGGFATNLTTPNTFVIIDIGARYTIIEEVPFVVTTVNSDRELKDFIENDLTGALRHVVPKKEGGEFTYISETDETLGANNGFSMTISKSERDLESDMDAIIDAAGTIDMIIEHHNFTVLIFTP